MNKIRLKTELSVLYNNPNNTEKQFIRSFADLFYRFLLEIPGEGLVYPPVDLALGVALKSEIEDIFIQNMKDITLDLTPEEYTQKIAVSLDTLYRIIPQILQITPADVITPSVVLLSRDLISLTKPVMINPSSTSYDIANAIVDGFVIQLETTTIFISSLNTTLNWVTS